MADSVEERIIADVVSTVQTVTTANGYSLDVAVVQRQQEDIDELRGGYPGAIVVHDGVSVLTRYIDATVSELSLAVVVGLERPGLEWATTMTNLLADISQALMADEGRGTFDGKSNARRTDVGQRFVGDHEIDGRGVVRGELAITVKFGFLNADESAAI